VARIPYVLTFAPEAPEAVVAQMDRLGGLHKGWINFLPLVREEDQPDEAVGTGSLFGASGPQVPICTWTVGKEGRRGIERDSLGIQHATGTKAVARLASLSLPLPQGWRWEQDHPKRGLVIRVPLDVSHATELSWLLDAGTALSRIRLTGQWEARVRPAP
jgi:hypothetical protein